MLRAAALAGALACVGSPGLAQKKDATMIAIETMAVGELPAAFDVGRTGQGGNPGNPGGHEEGRQQGRGQG